MRPHQQISHTARPLIWMLCRSVGYYSVTGWQETSLDCRDCNHSCTVIRTQSHDLWLYRKTENGRLPSGPPSEEIAIGRVYQNCKWKWMWARQFCIRGQKKSWCPSQVLISTWGFEVILRLESEHFCCDWPVKSGKHLSKCMNGQLMFQYNILISHTL